MVFSFLDSFINPWMLAGMLGVALPILAHLLSKRRYDVVDWGAMQFLELGQNARRKILLEQLLLLLLRIGLIALLVLAFMRPWAEGGMLASVVKSENRDIVLVIDGSYSMGWEGKSQTPHQQAVQCARQLLDKLGSGDSVALIDARDQARVVIESPTRDFGNVRQELAKLPPPSGTANLPEATRKAVQILTQTSNLSREVIIITDGQAKGWRADDKGLWAQYDDQLEQPTQRPRTWVALVGEQQAKNRVNFSIEKLTLNRELTAVGYPIRVKTKIRSFGGEAPSARKVFFEVDGARLDAMTRQVTLKPDNEHSLDFEYAFTQPGSHRLSVVLENDNLPGDNRAEAAITITQAVPVLLVDGDPHPKDIAQSETVLAHLALTPALNPAPWVKADVIPWTQFQRKRNDLKNYEAVFLANVPRLSDADLTALTSYVKNGGGLFIALGNKIDKTYYNEKLFDKNTGLLPAEIESLQENKDETKQTVQVVSKSLEVPWMQRFQREHDGGFCEARFSHRWKTRPAIAPKIAAAAPDKQPAAKTGQPAPPVKVEPQPGEYGEAIVAARLNTGDPLIITRKTGRGSVVLMTSAIDADWGTLIEKDDYTPLLHEIVFFLASAKTARNVDVGTPLLLEVPEDKVLTDYVFFGPGDTTMNFQQGAVVNGKKSVQLDETSLPGLYVFRGKTKSGKPDFNTAAEYFVVNFDRSESDLSPLSDAQRIVLTDTDNPQGTVSEGAEKKPRMTFFVDRDNLITALLKSSQRSEFWWLLLFVFLLFLVFEVVMTRRMVQGGHAGINEGAEPLEPTAAPSERDSRPRPPPLPAGAAAATGRRSVVVDELDYEEY